MNARAGMASALAGGVNRGFASGPVPNRIDLEPFIVFFGGQLRFSDGASLTMRIGWPYASGLKVRGLRG